MLSAELQESLVIINGGIFHSTDVMTSDDLWAGWQWSRSFVHDVGI